MCGHRGNTTAVRPDPQAQAGCGTAVIGFIEQGAVHVGDNLQIIREDGVAGQEVTCRGVESVRKADWHRGEPVPHRAADR